MRTEAQVRRAYNYWKKKCKKDDTDFLSIGIMETLAFILDDPPKRSKKKNV